jgi:hypothetical protein
VKRTVIVLVALGLSALGALAYACDCRALSWEERLAASDLVVLARVVEAKALACVVVDVRETFKGRAARRLRIPTDESDCDYFLPPVVATPGMELLIYATVRDGRVSVNRCLGSGPVNTDELMRLRRGGTR